MNEWGAYTGSVVDEWGNRVFGAVNEWGDASGASGVSLGLQEQEGMWQQLNRYHVNPGHWDDVLQGRVLRWPP